eukprot:CAMPEP_0202732232 /NCGR_PEP_ID=MMETSP1385-20130828/187553_1 /ASSEMBLY_ACC=CAM_ASM_000861 /TAXON_ID=933848 /ORGANISM="Elphidium margaritaceum" /LENGTH=527 /DNA_ID=CAMNT_0049398539 /DNA_START=33 /DNA_END=1617 /DNA_ORIENTATION=-
MDFGAGWPCAQLRFKRGAVAKEGDIVIVTGSRTHFQALRLKSGTIYNCKYGHFAHNDMIGQSFGSWIIAWKPRAQPTRGKRKKNSKKKTSTATPSHRMETTAQPTRGKRKKNSKKKTSTATPSDAAVVASNACANNGEEEMKTSHRDNDASSNAHSLIGHKRKHMDDDDDDDEDKSSNANQTSASRLGEICMLRPTCELYTLSLSHRTQIIYDADKALIVFMLQLGSNDVVFESGTGSGSLSTSLSRVISPHGHLFTFEFNEMRAEYARIDFQHLGIDSLITVVHRNIVQHGFPNKTQLINALRGFSQQQHQLALDDEQSATETSSKSTAEKGKKNAVDYTDCLGQNAVLNKLAWLSDDKLHNLQHWLSIFENEPRSQFVNGVFLDLPKPWTAIESAHAVLKENAKICSFSPCIEQVQKTCVALAENGFVDIRTFEVLSRDHLIKENTFVPLDMEENFAQHQKRANHFYKPKQEKADILTNAPKCWTSRPVAKSAGHTGYLTFAIKTIEAKTTTSTSSNDSSMREEK